MAGVLSFICVGSVLISIFVKESIRTPLLWRILKIDLGYCMVGVEVFVGRGVEVRQQNIKVNQCFNLIIGFYFEHRQSTSVTL